MKIPKDPVISPEDRALFKDLDKTFKKHFGKRCSTTCRYCVVCEGYRKLDKFKEKLL